MSFTILNPYAVAGEYRKAQLHCHTTESDGRFRPRELLEMYRDAGYSFVCITDHNRVTRCDDLNDAQFLAIPGTEDTVSRFLPPLGPHMGRISVNEPIRAGTPQERIDQTLASGGIVSLCHPSWNGNLWTGAWPTDAVRTLRGFQLIEVWNPHSDSQDDVQRWNAALLARGPSQPVWGVAVDDCHRKDQFDRGWVMVKVPDVTPEALRRALLGGGFYASTGPIADFSVEGSTIAVTINEPGQVRFVDLGGRVNESLSGRDARYTVRGDEGYVRVECTTAGGWVWSQPFWISSQ